MLILFSPSSQKGGFLIFSNELSFCLSHEPKTANLNNTLGLPTPIALKRDMKRSACGRCFTFHHGTSLDFEVDAQALVAILSLSSAFGKASGLTLNLAKCQLVPLVCQGTEEEDACELRAILESTAPDAATAFAIGRQATYLGFVVGPGAGEEGWTKPAKKFWLRTRGLADGHASVSERIANYATKTRPSLATFTSFSRHRKRSSS